MATSTTHYSFIKPDPTDTTEIITDLNTNYDSIDTELYDKADKDLTAVENNLAKFDSSGNPVDSGIASNTVPDKTTANLTFYVNPSTGNDNNNGSSGSPFKTIAKAISLIPQIVNHTVTINLADGSYSEGITLNGYVGKGSIKITGNITTPTDVDLTGWISVINCYVFIFIQGFDIAYVNDHAISVYRSVGVHLSKLVADDSTATYSGVYTEYSMVRVAECTLSNKKSGILSNLASVVYSENNDGVSNNIGITASAAGTIGKYGSQPSGTTAEFTYSGGVIR